MILELVSDCSEDCSGSSWSVGCCGDRAFFRCYTFALHHYLWIIVDVKVKQK